MREWIKWKKGKADRTDIWLLLEKQWSVVNVPLFFSEQAEF